MARHSMDKERQTVQDKRDGKRKSWDEHIHLYIHTVQVTRKGKVEDLQAGMHML